MVLCVDRDAVEAKEVTTLAVARAVLSDVGEAGMASS